MQGAIRNVHISALEDDEEDELTEPPAQLLDLTVIGPTATLRVPKFGPDDMTHGDPVADFRVPARSLLLALQALVADQPG